MGGTLGGILALAGADSSPVELAAASVLPAQSHQNAQANRLAGDGKEKVYGSIP